MFKPAFMPRFAGDTALLAVADVAILLDGRWCDVMAAALTRPLVAQGAARR